MGLFSSTNSYLGVDLGTSSVKVVELADMKGRPRLVTYGFTERKIGEVADGGNANLMANTDEVAAILRDICDKSKMTSKKVIAALPTFSVFTSVLNFPSMSKKELDAAIHWEAKKIIPLPIEEIILDWKIISQDEAGKVESKDGNGAENSQENKSFTKIFSKPQANVRVLLTGASKKLIKKYMEIFQKAGLNLLSLETESFALARSLVGVDKSVTAIIDLGAFSSNIIVVESGVPVLSRSVNLGGISITRAISSAMNVNLDRAEQFKQDMLMGAEIAENSLPQAVEKSFAPILNEIKYTLGLYEEQHGRKAEKIILTGGSALLGNLSGYLAKTLDLSCYLGDPWARVVYPVELRPVLDRIGSRFAGSIGLAMRNIE